MFKGTVEEFSTERAGGTVILDDGRKFRFTIERTEFPDRAMGIPRAGARVDVEVGQTRLGIGATRVVFGRMTASTSEPAVLLDMFDGVAVVRRVDTKDLLVVPSAASLPPLAPVSVIYESNVAFESVSSSPRPARIESRTGSAGDLSIDELSTELKKRWRRWCNEGEDEDDRRVVRGLLVALRALGVPQTEWHPILLRIARPLPAKLSSSNLTLEVVEKALGLPCGDLIGRLLHLCRALLPTSPLTAFEPLGLDLSPLVTPLDVLGGGIPTVGVPFAEDGGGGSFAFISYALGDRAENLPVLDYESDCREVVANDLGEFLSVIASGRYALGGSAAKELVGMRPPEHIFYSA